MALLDYPDKFRIEIKEKQRIIETEEKKLENSSEFQIKKELTIEEQYKRKQDKDAYRRKWVFEFFKELHPEHRNMTEEEYHDYIVIFEDEDTKKGYSILSFINKESPRELPNDVKIEK